MDIMSQVLMLIVFFSGSTGVIVLILDKIVWGWVIFPKRWPIKVRIHIKRQGGLSEIDDWARRVRDKAGREWYQLRKTRRKVKPTAFKYITETRKGLFAHLFSPNPKDFYPVKISVLDHIKGLKPDNVKSVENGVSPMEIPSDIDANIIAVDDDMRLWHINEMRSSKQFAEKLGKKSFWEVYMPVIMIALFGVAIMLIFVGYGELMKGMLPELQVFANTMRTAAEAMKGAGAGLPAPPV